MDNQRNETRKLFLESTKEAICDFKIDRADYYVQGSGENAKYFIVHEVSEELYNAIMRDEWAEASRKRRECRCMVTSDKTGQLIRCNKNNCENCPKATTAEAYKTYVGAGTISWDQYVEENESEPASVDSAEECIIVEDGIKQLIAALDEINPVLGDIIRMKKKEYNISNGDIVERLGFKKGETKGYRLIYKAEKLAKEFWDKYYR